MPNKHKRKNEYTIFAGITSPGGVLENTSATNRLSATLSSGSTKKIHGLDTGENYDSRTVRKYKRFGKTIIQIVRNSYTYGSKDEVGKLRTLFHISGAIINAEDWQKANRNPGALIQSGKTEAREMELE